MVKFAWCKDVVTNAYVCFLLKFETSRKDTCHLHCIVKDNLTMQSQKAVSAYFSNKQIPLFAFAWQSSFK